MSPDPIDYEASSAQPEPKNWPLIVGGVLLLGYPWCLMANIMSWIGQPDTNPDRLGNVLFQVFLWGTTFYPVVYFASFMTIGLMTSDDRPATTGRIAWIPLIYLAVILSCFALAVSRE